MHLRPVLLMTPRRAQAIADARALGAHPATIEALNKATTRDQIAELITSDEVLSDAHYDMVHSWAVDLPRASQKQHWAYCRAMFAGLTDGLA